MRLHGVQAVLSGYISTPPFVFPAEPGDGGGDSWQEQYDLGTKYLEEGNYAEAVLAFTAAIEIDPKRPEAYMGRGDAYVLSGETGDNLAAALADYQAALELDLEDPELYLKLIDVYTKLGDSEAAESIRNQGYEITQDSHLEPLCDHIWTEANYQQPQICQLCGQAQGDPLPAAFETDGLSHTRMELGVSYPYVTTCLNNPDLTTTGQATVTSLTVLSSDDTHPAKEGYQWHFIQITVTYQDDNARNYGMQNRLYDLDYYTNAPFSYPDAADPTKFSVNYQGQDYDCTGIYEITYAQWDDRVFTWSVSLEYQIPEGYEGCVLALFNAAHNQNNEPFSEICGTVLADPGTLYFQVA